MVSAEFKLRNIPRLQFILKRICIRIIVTCPDTFPPRKRKKNPEKITPTNLNVIINPVVVASPLICQAKTEKHITSNQRAIPEEVPVNQSLRN